ncbi:hypothetical protein [Streptomyces sp. NPDC015242]|uniref:hypothetical protein n=1 Tax=Streptomyces sp. NPDC015242 TaxID=3364951 RepID=UPI0036F5907B
MTGETRGIRETTTLSRLPFEEVCAVLSLKRLLDRSLTAQATLAFLLGLGISALSRRDEHPAVWVFHSALYTGVAIAVLAFQRRRAARAVGTDAAGLADLNRRIRHQEVPREPEEQAAMRRLVGEQLGQMERAGKWVPYWLGAMGLVAVGMFVLGAVSGSLLLPLVFAVAMVALCVWVLWMRRRSLDRLHSMRQALRQP